MERYPTLTRLLRERLSANDLQALAEGVPPTDESGYDDAFERVVRSVPRLAEHVERSQLVVDDRYRAFDELPSGQQLTVFEDCSPTFLLVLAHSLIERSYDARFSDTARSLALAECAVQAARHAWRVGGHPPETLADTEAAALAHLGNARRLRDDLKGAGEALDQSEALLDQGTGDRALHADLLRFRALMLWQTGYSPDAAPLIDREIGLRRLVGDDEKLGVALIDRGWIASLNESLELACRYIRAGVEIVEDPRMQTIALNALAERLARDGDGLFAWRTLATASLSLGLLDDVRLKTRHRWIKGLALRAMGQHREAADELKVVCGALVEEGSQMSAAFASIDLSCVLIAQGDLRTARELAEHAWQVFLAVGVSRPTLTALILLAEALRAETVTETLAVEVANFFGRHQANRKLRLRVRRR